MLQWQSVSPWLVWTVVLVVLCGQCPTFGEKCTNIISSDYDRGCACKTESGFIVNLHNVDCPNKDSQGPCFFEQTATASGDDAVYSYDPCKPISEGCTDAMICQRKGTDHYKVASAGNATFQGDYPDSLSVHYYGDKQEAKIRESEVQVKCGKTKFEAKGETSSGSMSYGFILHTPAACKNSAHKGLSTGSILCILLLVFTVVYLVGGILFLHFARGALGVEMVPNYEFWKDLPILVKDGALFSVNGCKSDRTYQQI